jgi:hypothetical protein
MTSDTSANASIGWGPFAVKGSYKHHDEKRDFSADIDGEWLRVPGIQLLGYISTINPACPAHDSSEFMQKKKEQPATTEEPAIH